MTIAYQQASSVYLHWSANAGFRLVVNSKAVWSTPEVVPAAANRPRANGIRGVGLGKKKRTAQLSAAASATVKPPIRISSQLAQQLNSASTLEMNARESQSFGLTLIPANQPNWLASQFRELVVRY
jgi:hypothetical protein